MLGASNQIENKESTLKAIAHKLRQKHQFQQKKEYHNKEYLEGIAHAIHPDSYERYLYKPEEIAAWKEKHDHKWLEELLFDRGKEQFRQAKSTPFMSAEMINAIPLDTDSRYAEEVLDGRDIVGPTLEVTQALNECRGQIEVDNKEITLKEIGKGTL